MTLDINLLRVAATLASFAVFIGICAWALARRNRARFDDAARLALAEDVGSTP